MATQIDDAQCELTAQRGALIGELFDFYSMVKEKPMITMPKMIPLLDTSLLCALLAASGCAAEPQGTAYHSAVFRGRVLDEQGQPLAGARLQFGGLTAETFPPIENEDVDALIASLTAHTDKNGRFTYSIRYGGKQLLVKSVRVRCRGYVEYHDTRIHRFDPGDALDLEYRLKPAEVLSGRIDPIVWGLDKAASWSENGKTAEWISWFEEIRATGDGFKQEYPIEPGGRFEVYVPRGTYTISVVGKDAKLEGVRSGTRNLVLRGPTTPIAKERIEESFDALWSDMDRHYSYFAHKNIAWNNLRSKYRLRALECQSLEHYVVQLLRMLAELKDMHVWIEMGGTKLSPYHRSCMTNWSPLALEGHLTKSRMIGSFAQVGTVREKNYGYVAFPGLVGKSSQVDELLRQLAAMRHAPGFVVDLRMCSGGDERIAGRVAGFFCAKETIYARHKYRNGPGHFDFAQDHVRRLEPSDKPYTKPVVCLIGNRTMSSAEAFALMMKSLPHVTTVGMRTRGSSGNPEPFELPGLNVKVWYSRWVAMEPDGRVFEDTGITPDIEVQAEPKEHVEKDPTFERALTILRGKETHPPDPRIPFRQ